MQQRVDVQTRSEADQTVASTDAQSGPSAREQALDRKIRFWTVLFVILIGIFALFKAYALLAPKYLS
ncbi:MAG: hypothetical protein AAFY64_02870 [Pseudomonadota bacterium]